MKKGVHIPEPDFTERTITVVTPTTYSRRTIWEPTAAYKKRMRQLKKKSKES